MQLNYFTSTETGVSPVWLTKDQSGTYMNPQWRPTMNTCSFQCCYMLLRTKLAFPDFIGFWLIYKTKHGYLCFHVLSEVSKNNNISSKYLFAKLKGFSVFLSSFYFTRVKIKSTETLELLRTHTKHKGSWIKHNGNRKKQNLTKH